MNEPPSVAVCGTCPRHCRLADGAVGFCRARKAENGRVVCSNYGCISSIALDPIEKKPLAFFKPGGKILSIGSYGCNLRCPFCQNDSISQADANTCSFQIASPDEIANLAKRLSETNGNIGLAYTYNEPIVGWEFVCDCAREIHKLGLSNVLVSNGCADQAVMERLTGLIDAANIDLKGASQEFYDWVSGDFSAVCRTIRMLHSAGCHVEVTTLVIPGKNDSDGVIDSISAFIASISTDIPLHITRFFPRYNMSNALPTPIPTIHRLADIARRRLRHVLIGNCFSC